MEPRENVRNLILLGSWNSLLFNPKWLNNNIFDGKLPEKVNTEVLIHGNSVLHRVFDLPHFKLEVSEERLCFLLKKYQDNYYQELIDAANNILTKLQHTPMKSLGINIVFTEKTKVPFEKAQNFYDFDNLSQANENLIISETDHRIRIAINRNSNLTEFDFNYSYNVESTAKVKEILISGMFNEKYDKSLDYSNNLMEKYDV
jgi:dsDNA-binding SOS-regulon protein